MINNMKNKKIVIISGLVLVGVILVVALLLKGQLNSPEIKSGEKLAGANKQSYQTDNELVITKEDQVIGSQKASLPIFVYEDVANIFSAELAESLDKVYQAHKKEVALVVRPFVIKENINSRDSYLMLECAKEQGKWQEMRELLLAATRDQSLSVNNSVEYGQALKLKERDFANCLTDLEKYEKLDELVLALAESNILGAPTMFIGEELIIGARPYDDYEDSSGTQVEGLFSLVERKLGELE
jgi:protein-disulfide isomerase